jgi:hypothetical protein
MAATVTLRCFKADGKPVYREVITLSRRCSTTPPLLKTRKALKRIAARSHPARHRERLKYRSVK